MSDPDPVHSIFLNSNTVHVSLTRLLSFPAMIILSKPNTDDYINPFNQAKPNNDDRSTRLSFDL